MRLLSCNALGLLVFVPLAPTQLSAKEPMIPDCSWQLTADLQPCIQAAIQKASVDSGTVLIPKGTWHLGKPLVLASSVTLMGETRDTTLMPTSDNVSKPVLLYGNNVNHAVVTRITFDGGGKDFANTNPVVEFTKSENLEINAITLQHSRGRGLVLHDGVNNSKVENSEFIDLGNHWKTTHERPDRLQGVAFCCGDNSNNEADDNVFRDIGLDALQISNQTDFKVLRNKFDLENHQRDLVRSADYAAAIFSTYSSGGLIQGNTINGAQGNGMDLPAIQSSVIENNTIRNCGAAGIGLFRGYDKPTVPMHIKIRDNVVVDNVQWGKPSVFKGGITISGGAAEDISIEHNTVSDDQGVKTQDYAVMIRDGTHVENLELKNNNFDGNGKSSVYRP